jgi:hypothetical protein
MSPRHVLGTITAALAAVVLGAGTVPSAYAASKLSMRGALWRTRVSRILPALGVSTGKPPALTGVADGRTCAPPHGRTGVPRVIG